jgi:putative transposase
MSDGVLPVGAPAPPPASGDGRAPAPDAPAKAPAPPDAGEGAGAPWRSRGYLPHFDPGRILQTITFRLADALPAQVVAHLAETCPTDANLRRQRIESYLDAGHGACLLRRDDCAAIVAACLQARDGADYHLQAWVVMPNHVHVLIEPLVDLARIVQAWKSVSSRRIVGVLGAARPRVVWQREYWDRYIRDERHRQRAVGYIHANPVSAGLAVRGELWKWSSAGAPAPSPASGDGRAPAPDPPAEAPAAPDAGEGAGAPCPSS